MFRILLSVPLVIAASLIAARPATAQTTYTWNGTAGPLWSSAGNWTGPGTAPVTDTTATGTLVVLGGTTQLSNTLDYALGVNSLSFAAGAGSFVVGASAANALTVGTGGITNGSSTSQTLNLPIILAGNQSWTNNTAATQVLVRGAVTTGGSNLTFAGAGNHTIESAITGGGTITKTGAGQLNLFQNNTNAALTINAGTVTATPIGAGANPNPLGTGLVTLAGGTLSFRNSISLTPVPLTAASFNQDVISSVADPTTTPFGTTISVDGANFIFFERGHTGAPNPLTDGLPSGGFLTSQTSSNQTFQLQGYGTAAANNNNVQQVGTNGAAGTGTITLVTPASFSQIAIANTTGSGPTTYNATLNFSDTTSTTYTGITGQNWFGGTGAIISGLDRMLSTTGVISSNGNDPQIYSTVLTLAAADQAKTLTSVTFNKTATAGALNVFALSGGFLSGFTGSPASLSYTNNFAVTGAATLDMGALVSLGIGNVSLGAQLTVSSGQAAPVLTTGPVTLTANGGLTLPAGMIYTPPAAITGAFTFTKAGAGQINLTKANTFSALTQTAGTTVVAPEAAAINPLGPGLVTLGGGTLSFRGSNPINPIALTPGSFNQDVIASVAEQGLATPFGTTTSVDAPAGFAYFERGRAGSLAGTGLPSGGLLVSQANANQTFQLQGYGTAAGTTNNSAQIGNVVGSTTLTLTTQTQAYSQLALAAVSGSGATTIDVVLNFTTGASSTYSAIGVPDWFGGANAIIQGIDRLNRTSGAYDNNTTDPRIYSTTLILTPADAVRNLASVTINKTSAAGFLNLFALSGGGGLTALTFPNNFAVTAASTIDITDISSVTIGGLSLGNTLSLSSSSGTAGSPALFTVGAVTVTNNFGLNYPNTVTPTFGAFTDSVPGTARTFTKAGTGILTIAAAGGTTVPLNLAAGSTFTMNNTNGTVNLNAPNSISSAPTGNLTFNVQGGTANLTVPNAFSTTTGVVTFAVSGGTANLNGLNALNAPAGRTNFTQTGGTLNTPAAGAFGNNTTTVVGNAGTWNIGAGNNYEIGSLNSTTVANAAAQTINLNGTTLTINGSDSAALSAIGGFRGRIANGSAAGSVVVTGGTTGFIAANPFSGGLTVSGGKVVGTMPGTLGTGPITLGSGTLALGGIPSAGVVTGFNAANFTANGGPTINADSSATVTTAAINQARSIFSTSRLPVDSNFTVAFRYTQSNTTDPANGVTITIQGAQPTAVGGNGTNFGASGISPAFTLAMNVQETNGGVSPGVNAFQNGNIAAQFFNPPSPGFPDPLRAQTGTGLELFVELTYNAATGTFTGRYGQRSPLDPAGAIIYIPLSDAQTPIGSFNGVIPAANMAYNLLQNIGGGAYIGVTGSTNGTATQTTQQVIDQFTIYGASTTTAVPASSFYNQPVTISGGSSATVSVIAKAGAADLSAGALTIGAGATGLTVAADSTATANLPYSFTFGATALNGTPTFTVNNNGTGVGTLTLGALNDGGTARTITKAGAGTLVLGTAAAGLVAGTVVNVTGGTLNLNNAAAIGTLAQLTTSTGTTVNANAALSVAGLAGAGALNLGGNTLTVNGALSGNYSGVIAGTNGSLLKAGTGTLTLSGANTYTGATTVNAGTLAVNNTTGSGTGTGLTTLNTGATLMGTGTVGGGLTVNTGANMAPGNSIGTLNAAGVTTWAGGGKFTVEYDGSTGIPFVSGSSIDYYSSTGSLALTATSGTPFIVDLKVLAPGPGAATTPTSIKIATFTGGVPSFATNQFNVTGDFSGASIPSVAAAGNDVVLTFTPVPEPVTVLGLAAAGLGLAGWARRRIGRTA